MRISSSTKTITIIVAIVSLAALYTFYVYNTAKNSGPEIVSEATAALADELAFTTLAGEPLTLSQYVGEGVLVVNSWASWCPFCVSELPDFGTLAAEYKDQDVTVIAINRKENALTANNYVKTLRNVDDVIFALDKTDAFYKQIGGFTMPETIFYDTNGNVIVHKRGFMTIEEMRTHTESALRTDT